MKKAKIKKLISGLSSACVLAAALPLSSLSTLAAENGEYEFGDVNKSGSVEIADAVLILQSIADPTVNALDDTAKDLADVNKRGNGVDAEDALAIQKYKAEIITSLPESYMTDPVSSAAYIHLKNTYIETEGDNITVDGTTVTITASGEYYVDGTLDDGQIIVNVPDEVADHETVKIFLNGVNITGASAPAIFVENAENTSINLADGTTNTLSDGTTAYSGDYLDCGVIEAKDDITVKGTGTLNITANTQYAIQCNNDIKFTGGTVNIETLLEDAVRGKTSVTVKEEAVLDIDAEGDGIKSTKGNVAIEGGTITVKAGNDAIQAETTIDISGGTIVAGGDRGLTGVAGVNITGGSVIATATDNQTDAVLLTATQGTMLLNCIDDISQTDGCWKKANSIGVSGTFMESTVFVKKYKYVLISDATIENRSTYTLTNGSTGATVTQETDPATTTFTMTDTITTFDYVNPAGSGDVVNPVTGDYTITLSSAGIATDAPSEVAAVSNSVITITQPGVFSVSGELSEGQIVVDVDKTAYPEGVVELDLMGVNLSNTTDSPIYVAQIGDEVQIVAKSGYDNTISDGTSYTNADGKMGAIYACDDLKIKGSGSLTVNGNCEDAIVCKNDLKIYNGTIVVNAVDDCIRGKDSVTIGNDSDTDFSTLNITVNSTGGDGIKSTETDTTTGDDGVITVNGGTINVTAYSDGFHASQVLNVLGGDITIETTCPATSSGSGNGGWGGSGGWGGPGGWGGESSSTSTEVSAKGLKAGCTDDETGTTIEGTINISGGVMNITTTDDSIHATDINILGGTITASSGDDGIHADQDLIIGIEGNGTDYSTPYIDVIKSYEGVEASNITQNSGTVMVTSSDDGYNAAGGTDSSGTMGPGGWNQGGSMGGGDYTLVINGGYTYVNAGGDGLDSNGTLTVNGGYVFVSQTGGGNSPIDCDTTWSYNGGVVVAGGSSDMFSESIPNSYSFLTTSSISAGSTVTFTNTSGSVIATMTFANASNEMVMCSPESSVTCYTGGTVSGATYFATSSANSSMKAGYGGTLSGGTRLG